jgi:hypothetical protein
MWPESGHHPAGLKVGRRPADTDLVGEDYFIGWQGDARSRRAGGSAWEKAAELRSSRSTWDALVDAVVGRRDDGWSWAKGAAGEAVVGQALATLPPTHWRVLHDLPIGDRGANVDHLVIGPPGVFTINTKHLSGRVDVDREQIRRNGRATRFLDAAVREADRVRAVLERAVGEVVEVEPLLVVHGAEVRVGSQPRDVTVLTSGQLIGWLSALPTVLTFEQWQARCRAATTPATWTGPEPSRGDAVVTPTGPVQVRRWQRHGHDRLYVRQLDGTEIGWMDLRSGTVHAHDRAAADRVRAAASCWLAT